MTDEELLDLNGKGLIPGPGELEEDFSRRVEEVKKKYEAGTWIPRAQWEWVSIYLKKLFDFEPFYLPAYYSNRGLSIWQGAASWIEGRKIVAIQMREGLRKGRYLGLYRREEILAHEAVHAARSGFDEDRNEEFFAYLTSEKRWRRALGPIVRRPWEVWPFVLFCASGMFVEEFFLGAALWAGLGFWRLVRQHRVLDRASKKILEGVGDEGKARAILFRLTDDEIARFAKGEKIAEYMETQNCLRWKVIRLAYWRDDGSKNSC